MRPLRLLAIFALGWASLAAMGSAQADQEPLASEFWTWRAQTEPVLKGGGFRAARPSGWMSSWSKEAVGERREALAKFEAQWQDFEPQDLEPQDFEPQEAAPKERLAHQHLATALAEVRWELDVHPRWRSDAWFYVLQTEGALIELLVEPEPLDANRSEEILVRLERIPQLAADAMANLDRLSRPSAEQAIHYLSEVRGRLQAFASELRPHLVEVSSERMYSATESAIRSLAAYRRWLEGQLENSNSGLAVGEQALVYLLDRMALSPWSAEEIRELANSERASLAANPAASLDVPEADEAVAQETPSADPPSPNSSADFNVVADRFRELDASVRSFVESRELLSLPEGIAPLSFAPLPTFLGPFSKGRLLTDLSRTFDRARPVRGVLPPTAGLIAWRPSEPVRWLVLDSESPDRYAALALAWPPVSERSPARSQSSGFESYVAAMLLEQGFWEEGSAEGAAVERRLGLEALAAEVALRLAAGGYSLEAATADLTEIGAMSSAQASDLALSLASAPELPILRFLVRQELEAWIESARLEAGEAFDLVALHGFAWRNSDLPVALLRLGVLASGSE